MSNTIAAIILTKNEEKHIERCIRSLLDFCKEIWVVDSFSNDLTKEIAIRLGAQFIQHTFKNQAQQFNWAISALDIQAEWIWRVDADEYVSQNLGRMVMETVQTCPPDVNGIRVNKAIVFMGRKLRHGGWYPAPQIKLIRKGYGESEHKVMDEHLVISSGRTVYIDGDQTDENLNSLTWWTEKHNHYATREAENMLMIRYGLDQHNGNIRPRLFGNDTERKRWFKIKYAKLPLFVRPFINFFIRYVLKGGFLDGKEGLMWHILQGFWYRFLVDAKIFELKKQYNWNDEDIKQYIADTYIKPIGGVKKLRIKNEELRVKSEELRIKNKGLTPLAVANRFLLGKEVGYAA